MTKNNIIELLSYLSNCYSGRMKFPKSDKRENKMMVEVWYDFLKSYDREIIDLAAKKLVINNSKWPPSVGEIIKEVKNLQKAPEEKLSPGMAWSLVLSAVRKYGYYNSKEGMESLPPKVRETVEHYGGFASICHSEENNVYVKNQFFRLFKEVNRHNRDLEYLPPGLKKELFLISSDMG
ncbi:replicative helicase loader/inhibitor [Halanaerobium hydrogeniformans]|uniref:Replicative helicase inhibitor G39P N-terminal domain-containing protein n=1 Tax=Halanaerobium hydrogeniformans TaxID=656519 RepID=E4RNN5_HALHG|nr:replicative helicase loader/inhibitor [Halanaerobium hydrogeniformans]ADQ13713.1 hypothetical protein Halsa_0229 [Halanaerobium hydrogeniformans]